MGNDLFMLEMTARAQSVVCNLWFYINPQRLPLVLGQGLPARKMNACNKGFRYSVRQILFECSFFEQELNLIHVNPQFTSNLFFEIRQNENRLSN
jgi:hypothetical protein